MIRGLKLKPQFESDAPTLFVYVEPIAVRSVTMSTPLKKISLKMQALEENQLITAAVEPDPDALPLADAQMIAHDPHAGAARSSKGGD